MLLLAACSDDPPPTAPPPPPPADTDTADRAVLIDLFNATGGPDWRENGGWNTPASIRNWHGVRTDGEGFVTELDLSANGLSGTLPARLGELSRLERLALDDNEIGGAIPASVGALAQLTFLELGRNQLTGPIPPELGNLARLDSLQLAFNSLAGPVPAELGNLASLRRLLLAWNELSGPVPPELGNLTNLTYMSLSRNQLAGTVPPELGNLSAIEILSVSRNNLTGTIPTELGDLDAVEGLYLYDNRLTGRIPDELAALEGLETLWLHQNRLTGPIPEAFGNLVALQDLRAETNRLNGQLPAALGEMRALSRLWLADNDLEGTLPPGIGALRDLETLRLEGNERMAGLLPRELLNLAYLENLSYAGTALCAQIDREFQDWLADVAADEPAECEAAHVERLALGRLHAATGGEGWAERGGWGTGAAVADWHGVGLEGERVVELSLAGNGLAGTLPPVIANLTALRRLELGDNNLVGDLPPALAWLPDLTELRLEGNEGLAGRLPFALRNLGGLRALAFDRTGLCASPAASFQSWLAGIPEWTGATCPNPDQVTISLELAYLVQSVQEPRRRVSLVANREALLRVFLTAEEPRGFFEPEVSAVFARDGSEVHRAVLTRDDDRIPGGAEEGELGQSWNAAIPAEVIAPGLTMVVEADPAGALPLAPASRTRWPEAGVDSLRVVEVSPLRITLVPVVEAAEPDTSVLAWTRGIDGDSPQLGLLRHSFPFSELQATGRATYMTSLDLTTEAGQHELLDELEALRTADNGTGHYYGVASSVNGFVRGWGLISGWISMGKAIPVELAHEIGHNLSLRHAPCGNPLNIDPAFPYRDGSIGVWGYDFRDGNLLPPDRSRDLMSYCQQRAWLSDYHHARVIDYRAGLAADGGADIVAADAAPTDLLVLWGGILNGEPRLNPPFAMRGRARVPQASGPWRIQGGGRRGESLFSLDFTPGEDGYGGGHFFFAIPIEPGWADALERITLSGPEGTVWLDHDDERAITVVRERGTGRIRAILRDWEGAPPTLQGDRAELDAVTTRGPGEAVRLRR